MPRITEDTVDSVARLARLSLTPDERARFARELEAILGWAESLQSLELQGVAPVRHAVAGPLREDEPCDGLPQERALDPAPDPADGLFRVPRILP